MVFVPMRSCRCEDDEPDSEPETEGGVVSVGLELFVAI